MKKTTQYLSLFVFLSLVILLLAAGVKGRVNDHLLYQSSDIRYKEVTAPFESSSSTSRYALTEAIVEEATLFLSKERAKFASPDVAEYEGRYFTLFTPGTSFIAVPFYWVGKIFGMPQLITFLSSTIFAFINMILIIYLGRRLNLGFFASLLSGFLFLFATNALSYSFTLSQHQISTLIILLGTINAIGKRNLVNNITFGLLYGLGLLVDIPNGLLMFPQAVYILIKHFELKKAGERINFKFKLNFVHIIIGLIPLLFLFGLYNYSLTGSYTKLAQIIGRTKDFSTEVAPTENVQTQESFALPFKTRNLIKGLPLLLVSNQRGIFFYNTVVIFGLITYVLFYIQDYKKEEVLLIISIVIISFLTYSMFHDPYGGWAFGPRYLIPATALLSVGIGKYIQNYNSYLAYSIFAIICFYSIGVNVLGAVTSTQVPPKEEAIALSAPIPYTYEYNWQLLKEDKISPLLYNTQFKNSLSPEAYLFAYEYICMAIVFALLVLARYERRLLYEH